MGRRVKEKSKKIKNRKIIIQRSKKIKKNKISS